MRQTYIVGFSESVVFTRAMEHHFRKMLPDIFRRTVRRAIVHNKYIHRKI